jgi:hypothetical protein
MVLVAAGELAGLGVVLALARVESGVLYGVSARDPWIGSAAFTFLFAVSLAAAFWPAWSASRDDFYLSLKAL